jgi:ABC-type transport system substrate-binding protein
MSSSENKLIEARKNRKICIGCDDELSPMRRIISADQWGYCLPCFNRHILDSLIEVNYLMRVNNTVKDGELAESWEIFKDNAEMLIKDLKTYIKKQESRS